MINHSIIPIFVPHLGCPHDCVFCNQRKITNSNTNITYKDVEDTIEEYVNYFKPNSLIEVAFYGGSFTAIDNTIQNELLSIALEYKLKGVIDKIRVSTRPDAINKDILKNLKKHGVNTIELGVQSLDDMVLNASGRGHSSQDVYNAVDLIKTYDFKLGLQMMLGLPKDTIEKNLYTANQFIKLRPDFVRIYPTLVIRDTFLESLEIQNKYKPLSLEEAINRVSPLMILFYLNNIDIIRVGLQATENIQLGRDVVSGPFHPSFRQLADSNIYKQILNYYFDNLSIETKNTELEISLNYREVSNLVGQNASNTKHLKDKYKFKKIKILGLNNNENYIIIRIDSYIDKIDKHLLMEDILGKFIINNLY